MRTTSILVWCGLFICCLGINSGQASPAKVTELFGDQQIQSDTLWQDGTYKIHGSLVLVSGTLTVQNATVEIMCEFARHHEIIWQGGKLITRHAAIGGTKREGVTSPTVFYLYDGEWHATDTCIQYSCGVVFSYNTPGKMVATRLTAGENPDSIIVCGKADVSLQDSVFDLALHLPAYTGKECTLDLPLETPLNTVYNNELIPGVEFQLNLNNSTVPTAWFVFFVSVREDGPVTRYNLRQVTNLVPAWSATNLQTVATMPCSWSGDEWPGEWDTMPAGTEVSIGSLRVKTLTDQTIFAGWGVYLHGPDSEVTIRGTTNICELMVEEGVCRVEGEADKHNIWLTCTTTDATRGGQIFINNANLAYYNPSDHYKQVQANGAGSKVILNDVVFGDHLQLIAEEGGEISIEKWSGNREGVSQRQDSRSTIRWVEEATSSIVVR